MELLRQSTAVTLKIGPFIDDTDGKTAETGLTIAQADVRLSKNGGNMAQKNEGTSCTHDELGYYDCPVDTTDTDTLGRLKLMVHESGALPVWEKYMVITQNAWDSLFSTDKLQVDVQEWLGQACHAVSENGVPKVDLDQIQGVGQSAIDLKDFADDGYDPETNKVQGVVLVDTTTTNSDMISAADVKTAMEAEGSNLDELHDLITDSKIAAQVKGLDANVITASVLNADAVDEIVADILVTPAQKVVTDASGYVTANLNGDLTATMKASVNTEVGSVLNTAIPGSPTADSINERVKAIDDKLPSKSYLAGSADADGGIDITEAAVIQGEAEDAVVAKLIVRTNTAQAGGANTITLDAGASSTNDWYINQGVYILSGVGAGQSRKISSYVGATKVATLDSNWATNPDNTSVFIIYPNYILTGSGATATEVWEHATRILTATTGFNDLSAQEVRDAMKLAPAGGDPSAGSVDKHLDEIELDTNELQTNQGNWATATGFSTHDAAAVKTAMEAEGSNLDELHDLIAESKIAAQVKGLDADVLTAAALNADAVTEIATAVLAKTVDGSLDVTEALTVILALLTAKSVTKVDNVYTYKDQAGDTKATMTLTAEGATVVLS